MKISEFFPENANVIFVPRISGGGVYFYAIDFRCFWKLTSFYGAFKIGARIFKIFVLLFYFLKNTLFPRIGGCGGIYREIKQHVAEKIIGIALITGRDTASQKFVCVLVGEDYEVISFLKCGASESSVSKISHEREVLAGLPEGIAPEVIRYGAIGSISALELKPVEGRPLRVGERPVDMLVDFHRRCQIGEPIPFEEHPWVQNLNVGETADVAQYLKVLSDKKWPVVAYHGDLFPWHLYIDGRGMLVGIDWEYGSLEGFPWLDMAGMSLLEEFHLRGTSPARARTKTVRFLNKLCNAELSTAELDALTRVAAWSLNKERADEVSSPAVSEAQIWRNKVWAS